MTGHLVDPQPESIRTEGLGEVPTKLLDQIGFHVGQPDTARPPITIGAPQTKRIRVVCVSGYQVAHFPRYCPRRQRLQVASDTLGFHRYEPVFTRGLLPWGPIVD